MLLVLAAAATLAWWSPQIGWVRSSLLSIAVLHVAVRLRGAVRRRRRPTA